MSEHKPPKVLDAMADLVLAYRPKAKSKGAKKRKKTVKKLAAQSARSLGDQSSQNRK
jgi:hypothetical protein